jgi:hypothetical protein
MAIAFRSAGSISSSAATTSLAVTPGTIVAGDVLVLILSARGGTGVTGVSAPAGFNSVRRDNRGTSTAVQVWTKTASSESGTYTVSWTGSNNANLAILAYSGVDTSAPVDVSGSTGGASTANPATPDVTTVTPNTMLLAIISVGSGGTWTAPGTMTERVDAPSTAASNNQTLGVFEEVIAATGATGTRTATVSTAGQYVATAIALKPSATSITATLNATQAADTSSSAGTVAVAGAASGTQAAQTASGAGTVAIAGSATPTQAAQTLSAAGTAAVVGSASNTQAAQAVTSVGAVAIAASAALTQAAQTLSSSSSAGHPYRETRLYREHATYRTNSPFVADRTASLTVTQAAQTLSAAGTVAVTGAAEITQAAQTSAATGAVAVAASAAVTQDAQTLSAAGTVASTGRTATLNATQDAQTSVAAGTVAITASAAFTQAAQTLAATGTVEQSVEFAPWRRNRFVAAALPNQPRARGRRYFEAR